MGDLGVRVYEVEADRVVCCDGRECGIGNVFDEVVLCCVICVVMSVLSFISRTKFTFI